MASVPLLRQLPRSRPYVCQTCLQKRRISTRKQIWAGGEPERKASQWRESAERIRSGAQPSMLTILEDRGYVKDIAGGRDTLDWLLTTKPIAAYVGVDPTAPSLHVGHLLPLMVLYWMYMYGYHGVTLLGGGTVRIGDPSGRTSARAAQARETRNMNTNSMFYQLRQLWVHVKALGIKHKYPIDTIRQKDLLNNSQWLKNLSAVALMTGLGSGMRLGTMLSRDSVKQRMASGDGMAVSEFCYPLFQGYDWWHMYSTKGVQLQIGGSDQYGNICAGMDAVDHMRKTEQPDGENHDHAADTLNATFGLTTPLLTTASGEKFGKSAGNAVWLDQDMMSSFDLYQYFLRTADDDVERYLKLFTFIPLDKIRLIMQQHLENASQRSAQHMLAKQVVELAHGALAAKNAELAHKDAFGRGTHVYSLLALRNALKRHASSVEKEKAIEENAPFGGESVSAKSAKLKEFMEKLTAYKKNYLGSSSSQGSNTSAKEDASATDTSPEIVTIPESLLQEGTFPQILHAAGLVSSKSEGHRIIKSKGAYAVLPNSGLEDNPYGLTWTHIPEFYQDVLPIAFLIDQSALVLRTGKSKIKICRIILEEDFEAQKLSCPGWEEFKAKRAKDSSPRKEPSGSTSNA